MREQIIFEIDMSNYKPVHRHEDVPEAYRVVKDPLALSGLIVEARYRGEWMANPHSHRPLVRILLERLGKAEEMAMAAINYELALRNLGKAVIEGAPTDDLESKLSAATKRLAEAAVAYGQEGKG